MLCIWYKIYHVSRKYKIQSEVNGCMLAKYTYKYIQLQIHRLALVCWQPVSCDESESSPTVIKGHASLLNKIFFWSDPTFCCLLIFLSSTVTLRSWTTFLGSVHHHLFFLWLSSKCWMRGPFGHYCPLFCPVLIFVQKLSLAITINELQFVNNKFIVDSRIK